MFQKGESTTNGDNSSLSWFCSWNQHYIWLCRRQTTSWKTVWGTSRCCCHIFRYKMHKLPINTRIINTIWTLWPHTVCLLSLNMNFDTRMHLWLDLLYWWIGRPHNVAFPQSTKQSKTTKCWEKLTVRTSSCTQLSKNSSSKRKCSQVLLMTIHNQLKVQVDADIMA